MKKPIKDIYCKGRLPDRRPCEKLLYQTDSEFLMINGDIINIGQAEQTITCRDCGTKASWTRNRKFISKLSPEKFQRKFQG